MRRKIVAGNWKMNLLSEDAEKLFNEILVHGEKPSNVQLMVFPPIVYLSRFGEVADASIQVGVQNFFQKENGAFTGEVSISQIKDLGAQSALIGHSERRAYFGEHADFLKEKVDAAIEHKLSFIYCCGEPLEVRESGTELDFVKKQLTDSLFHLSNEDILYATIAYEPVWAIGTGKTASNEQAEDMHANIRGWIADNYGMDIANKISILYGGSCNPENAKELFACPNVDGGLIGGASLKANSFMQIANSF